MRLQQVDLSALKAELALTVDAAAEAVRERFLTPGSGQAMVYLRKEEEARAYLADPEKPAPHIHAEALATGQTAEAVAQLVVGMADQWAAISAGIEAQRQGAKKAISEAATIAEARRAAQVDWMMGT